MKSENVEKSDSIALAMYPVAEIKRLYAEHVKYMQAIQYIEALEKENKQLKQYIKINDLTLQSEHHTPLVKIKWSAMTSSA